MKNNLYLIILTLLALILTNCSVDAESDLVQEADQTRISIFPSELLFVADGATESGDEVLNAIVTVNPFRKKYHNWIASLEENSWASIEPITFDGDDVTEKGLKIKVQPNKNYKRSMTLTITLDDGTANNFKIVQIGEKADAYVNIHNGITQLEYMADDIKPKTLSFDTNMSDYHIEVAEGVDWINVVDKGNNHIEIVPTENTAEDAGEREAKIFIHVGTPETSEAVAVVYIKQLAPETFSFIWGSSLPDHKNVGKAIKMEKLEEGLFRIDAYFRNGTLRIGRYADEQRYPQYYLIADSRIGVIENEDSDNRDITIPAIDIDGMRSLLINLTTLQYTLERITTQNSMPDHMLSEYPTRKYIARDGTMKEWIVAAIRWDGGNIIPKLGGKLVPSAQTASGGYKSNDELPQHVLDPKLNPAYEEAENGGQLQGDDKYGRIYSYSEMLTGVARGGIDGAINQTFPVGWRAGDKIVDAAGNEIIIDYVTNAMMTGDNSIDETNHPTLTWQLQGICPYGYHIANAQDWLDLAYSMSVKSQEDSYPVNAENITYKQFMTTSKGINNMAAWLRNTTHWQNTPIADGADAFGFNYFPTGFRYLKQGWQMYGLRKQVWVPLLFNETKAYRLNVVINNNAHTYVDMRNVDNGNAILPFRCVRNYKHELE
ncbi:MULTISPECIES: FISUMP domain-containing protein [unclassified Proteiniphilum]|uniref:FISUMP domain-containing protein n=1 Tax=unclassified Proteiniphilum TaxID=2622718 RepID=UPI00257FCE7A|nr:MULTISPECIES: FISUMP domain-containing protein [unclassified Proteiniphilum]